VIPFQELRRWAREAAQAEKLAAGTAAAALLGALVWVVVPPRTPSGNVASTAAGAGSGVPTAGSPAGTVISNPATASPAGRVGTGGSIGSAGSPTAGASAGSAGSGSPSSSPATGLGSTGASGSGTGRPAQTGSGGGAGCGPPPAGAPGVSATTIRVAVTLTNIAGPAGNQTFGVPAPSDQQNAYQAVIDSINAAGGVACRKLVPQYYQVNPADLSDVQQKCLDIVQSQAFAALDTASEAFGPTCLGQAHVPLFVANYLLTAKEVNQFYPYIFDVFDNYDSLYHNTVFALRDRGFFQPLKGFSKLGFVYLDCFPETITEFTGWLHEAGVPSSRIVPYDAGCPSPPIPTPSAIEQAILKFQQAGVTNLTYADFAGGFSNFTTIAEQQGFRPKYGIPDDIIIAITYGNQHPDYNNIAGALAVTASRYGEERTPGMAPTPGTARCNAIYRAHGLPPVYGQFGLIGAICDEVLMFAAAVDHAPALSREAIGAGLQSARTVDFSYPFGPNDFSGYHVTTGGQYWRTDEFFTRCDCWQVVDPAFHPSYR
jgi:hypothetical protein